MSPLATTALLPVLVPQALWVRMRAARLSEAAGPREGRAGDGPPLRLLILGDSSAAGVGVADQQDALAGHVVRTLAAHHRVDWRLLARCGDTTANALDRLQVLGDARFDMVVTALGVNDVKNGVPLARWTRDSEALLARLTAHHGAARVVMTGVPPLGTFPLLPSPLRRVLGARADRFAATLDGLVARCPEARLLALDLPLDPALMAADGFHPGPEIYRLWGEAAAAACLAP